MRYAIQFYMLVAAVARAPKAATNPKTGQLYTAPTISKVFKEHCCDDNEADKWLLLGPCHKAALPPELRWWCTPRSFSHPRSWDLHHVHKQMAATWRCRFNQHRENLDNARTGARMRESTPTCAGKHNAPLAYVKRPNTLLNAS